MKGVDPDSGDLIQNNVLQTAVESAIGSPMSCQLLGLWP